MNVFFTHEAQKAFKAANEAARKRAESLLGSYSAAVNRHYEPGKSTLKNISKQAREALSLPPGTRVFETGEQKPIRYCYHGERLDQDCPYCAEETGRALPMKVGDRLIYAGGLDGVNQN